VIRSRRWVGLGRCLRHTRRHPLAAPCQEHKTSSRNHAGIWDQAAKRCVQSDYAPSVFVQAVTDREPAPVTLLDQGPGPRSQPGPRLGRLLKLADRPGGGPATGCVGWVHKVIRRWVRRCPGASACAPSRGSLASHHSSAWVSSNSLLIPELRGLQSPQAVWCRSRVPS
jgi:hypothetical protein